MNYRLCEKCEQRPVPRGIKTIVCDLCGKETLKICDGINICTECCNKENRCDACGKKLNGAKEKK